MQSWAERSFIQDYKFKRKSEAIKIGLNYEKQKITPRRKNTELRLSKINKIKITHNEEKTKDYENIN